MTLVDLFIGTTSFRPGEKDRTHRVWTLYFPPPFDFKVVVHRHHYYPATQWLVSCQAANIDYRRLSEVDIEKAKVEALQIVSTTFQSRLKRINDALAQMAPDSASTPPPPSSPQPPSD